LAIVNGLLVAFTGLLPSPNGDTRFLCLKGIIDILSQYVSDRDVYQVPRPSPHPSLPSTYRFLRQCVLPEIPAALSPRRVIWLWVTKRTNLSMRSLCIYCWAGHLLKTHRQGKDVMPQ
jgi:hypothetical protein